jgi:hypothetical protein
MTTIDTTEAHIISRLPEIRARIAELRRTRCHLTAGIMRDEALCQIERWLDPDGLAYREEVQTAQRASAARLARAIDDYCNF